MLRMCPLKLVVLPSTLIMHGFEAVAYSQRAWNVVLAEFASAFHAYALPTNIRFGSRLIIAGAGGLPDSSAAGATLGRKFCWSYPEILPSCRNVDDRYGR